MGGGGKGGSPSVPKPPKITKTYGQGVGLNLQYLPEQLSSEQGFRTKTDPQRIQAQQDLQDQFGPRQYQQQIDAFKQLDPGYVNARNTMASHVVSDANAGTSLTPDQETQIQQYVRGAQSARGNITGGGAADAEAYALGDRGQQMYQQRLQNLNTYLTDPTMAAQVSGVAPISPDRSFAYVNPNAGFQGIDARNQQYQSQVGAAAANSSGGGGGWGQTLQTVGQIAGMVAMFASDRRLKKDITKVGTGPSGAGIYEFSYKGHRGEHTPRHIGYMADEVERVDPGHVRVDPTTGYKAVSEKYAPARIS